MARGLNYVYLLGALTRDADEISNESYAKETTNIHKWFLNSSDIHYDSIDSRLENFTSIFQRLWIHGSKRETYLESICRDDYIRERFKSLVIEWKNATMFFSSTEKITNHISFIKIIGLGPTSIPLILEEIQREPSFLFFALQIITNEDLTEENDAGKVLQICEKWINWAKERELI
jgi:hypothetical protein